MKPLKTFLLIALLALTATLGLAPLTAGAAPVNGEALSPKPPPPTCGTDPNVCLPPGGGIITTDPCDTNPGRCRPPVDPCLPLKRTLAHPLPCPPPPKHPCSVKPVPDWCKPPPHPCKVDPVPEWCKPEQPPTHRPDPPVRGKVTFTG